VTASQKQLDRSHLAANNGVVVPIAAPAMVSALSQTEVLIALIVAAHAGVLAVRLSVSLYNS
jgi:photosystem I subunit 12